MTEPADSAALWNDLKQLIRNVVDEMNRLEELSSKTGGLDYQLSETGSIIVTNHSLPRLSITISRRPDALEVASSILVRGAEPNEAQESLAITVDENGPSFRSETGEIFTVEETVYYILRPFLHLNNVASLTATPNKLVK